MSRRKQRSDAYAALRALDDFDRIEGWLLAGVSPRDIATHLRERGHFQAVKEKSLVRRLQRLRAASVPSEGERLELVSELRQLVALADDNAGRIDVGIGFEKALGRLLDSTREAIAAQTTIIARIHSLKKRLGLWRCPAPSWPPLTTG